MLTTDEMAQLLNQLDKDGDGEINFRLVSLYFGPVLWLCTNFKLLFVSIFCFAVLGIAVVKCIAKGYASLKFLITATFICSDFTLP